MLVSIYIRKDDEEKWKALKNKTEVISKLLNANTINNTISTVTVNTNTVSSVKPGIDISNVPLVKKPLKPLKVPKERLDNGLCKVHGTPLTDRGKCLQKGCKYA